MSDLIIITETDIRQLLAINDIKPSVICTSIKNFIPRMPYLSSSNIVILFRGCCEMVIPEAVDIYDKMSKQLEVGEGGIVSLNVVTDIDIKDFKDYYKYTDANLRSLSKYHNKRIVKHNVDLFRELKYEQAEKCNFIDNKHNRIEQALKNLHNIEHSVEYLKLKEIISSI